MQKYIETQTGDIPDSHGKPTCDVVPPTNVVQRPPAQESVPDERGVVKVDPHNTEQPLWTLKGK